MEKQKVKKPANSGKTLVKRDDKGRILPGEHLNPAGPKPGYKHFSTIILQELKREVELKGFGKMPSDKAMVIAMIRKSITGDVPAFNAVADRVDGKAKTEATVTLREDKPILGGLTKKK